MLTTASAMQIENGMKTPPRTSVAVIIDHRAPATAGPIARTADDSIWPAPLIDPICDLSSGVDAASLTNTFPDANVKFMATFMHAPSTAMPAMAACVCVAKKDRLGYSKETGIMTTSPAMHVLQTKTCSRSVLLLGHQNGAKHSMPPVQTTWSPGRSTRPLTSHARVVCGALLSSRPSAAH